MEPNGKGITEKELRELPEVFGVVLWQDDKGPIMVTDSKNVEWTLGFYKGVLSKDKVLPAFMWRRKEDGGLEPILKRIKINYDKTY